MLKLVSWQFSCVDFHSSMFQKRNFIERSVVFPPFFTKAPHCPLLAFVSPRFYGFPHVGGVAVVSGCLRGCSVSTPHSRFCFYPACFPGRLRESFRQYTLWSDYVTIKLGRSLATAQGQTHRGQVVAVKAFHRLNSFKKEAVVFRPSDLFGSLTQWSHKMVSPFSCCG